MTLISTSSISEAPCKGNGITLGLTNGTSYAGLYGYTEGTAKVMAAVPNKYGVAVGQGSPNMGIVYSLGITTEPDYSGIVCDLSAIPTFKPYFYIRY